MLFHVIGAGDAMLVFVTDPTAPSFSGKTFLVVDVNGDGAYASGPDYLIDVTGFTGTLSASNFI